MILRWTWILGALLLLVPPPVLSAELRRVLSSMRRSESVGLGGMAAAWHNWVDLARAFIGTLILCQVAVLDDGSAAGARKTVVIIQSGLLIIALLVQVLRWNGKSRRPEQQWQVVAPLFYLSGITLALSGYLSGAFAVFVAWLFAVAAKNPHYQLPVMAVALGAAGYVFGRSLELYCNLLLIALPFVVAFMLRKRLNFVGLVFRLQEPVAKGLTP